MPSKPSSSKPSPVERSTRSRQRGIARMELQIGKIEKHAREEVAAIRKRIEQKRVLLDALKRGQIAP